jgi:hypothetical protein
MSCYICKDQKVDNDGNGHCDRCKQDTCGPPPARQDGEFHGDTCSVCDVFFCENHLHGHPHAGGGVSSVFSAFARACATALIDGRAPNDTPRIQAFNRYLNVISPGATALLAGIDNFPPGAATVATVAGGSKHVLFSEGFLVRVAPTVTLMAERSIRLADRAVGIEQVMAYDPAAHLPLESESSDLVRHIAQIDEPNEQVAVSIY